MKCRVCGCTDERACLGGCYWVEPELCSRCADKETKREKNSSSASSKPYRQMIEEACLKLDFYSDFCPLKPHYEANCINCDKKDQDITRPKAKCWLEFLKSQLD